MTTWILYLMLANGEVVRIGADPNFCEYLPVYIQIGHSPPPVYEYHGSIIEITRAACHGPKNVDPCEVPAS